MTFNDLDDERTHSNTLLVSRSINGVYKQIRGPLTALPTMPADVLLLIIGGSTLPIAKVRTEIQKLLPLKWRAQCKIVNSIDALDVSALRPGLNVICLQELENPLFSTQMNVARWSNLQTLLLNSNRVVWLTKNRRTGSPKSGMFVGIARSLEQELPHLTLQMLDIEDKEAPNMMARYAVETFVRLLLTSDPAVIDSGKLLWTLEHEIVISNGQTLVPRILPVDSMNKRFNAISRETVQTRANLAEEVVELRSGRRGLMLVQVPGEPAHLDEQHVKTKFKIRYALPC